MHVRLSDLVCPEVRKMTYQNSLALLAALGMCFFIQILVARACVTDSSKSSPFAALPAPAGAFAVGRITADWTDESRIEPLSENHEPRELMVPQSSQTEPRLPTWIPRLTNGRWAKRAFEINLGTRPQKLRRECERMQLTARLIRSLRG